MSYLLDTCVLSEYSKPKPNAGVLQFVDAQQKRDLYVSVLTIGEVQRGILQLPASKRRAHLESWLHEDLKERFKGRCLPVDIHVAEQWSIVTTTARRKGYTIPVVDGLLVATAIAHNLTFVTRDVTSLQWAGGRIANPWS